MSARFDLLPLGDPLSATADDLLARDLAVAAGELLLDLRTRLIPEGGGSDPTELRKAGDRQSHEFLMAELGRLRPDDAVLSEEGKDDPARLAASRVWIVDPLDGTREFGEAGRTDWAVHVALWERGALTAGAVALPAQDLVLSTAELVAPVPPPAQQAPLRLLVSRSRPPAFVQEMAARLSAELVPLGSAGAKAAAVLAGQADAYVHSGGQYEWDSAAPVAVAMTAGLHASRIDGSKLEYNQAEPSLPDILICRAPVASLLLGSISSVLASDPAS